jgi:hypothetical protein
MSSRQRKPTDKILGWSIKVYFSTGKVEELNLCPEETAKMIDSYIKETINRKYF